VQTKNSTRRAYILAKIENNFYLFSFIWSESFSEDNVNWGGGAGSSEYKASLAQLGPKPGLGMCKKRLANLSPS
jgi:hypothetical protein